MFGFQVRVALVTDWMEGCAVPAKRGAAGAGTEEDGVKEARGVEPSSLAAEREDNRRAARPLDRLVGGGLEFAETFSGPVAAGRVMS